jgi:decaprenylphospho-beta-D-ribofuranose 2-oxidase
VATGPTTLTGWGRTTPSAATVVERAGRNMDGLAETVKAVGRRGAIARGLGRSYGDSAQNGGGTVIRLLGHAHEVVVDDAAGTATVPAGVSIDELLRVIVPRGWFVPVTPGTRFVTVGGAIASDIHGKNHHVDGSFGRSVVRLSLLLASGEVAELSPTACEPSESSSERTNGFGPELFWATVAGMGLTGIVVDATIRLIPISTSRLAVDTDRVPDLDGLLAAMEEGDEWFRYSVAWIDPMARGAHLGRGVLTRADHATIDMVAPKQAVDPLTYDPRQRIAVPPVVPAPGVINHTTIKAFNELWYRKAPRRRIGQIMSIAGFFYPLDMVGSWNRLYGRGGFVQYQLLLPFGQEDALRQALERFAASGAPSFLAVLKRFGAANPAPLSFPAPGWTLTVDVPAPTPGLRQLFHGLDALVLDAGGRHYLAKDSHMTPDAVRRGYPRLAEWQAIRAAVDPMGVWVSDQARRLRLLGD